MLIHCKKCGRLLDKINDEMPEGYLLNRECRNCRYINHVSVVYKAVRVNKGLTMKNNK